MSSTDDPVRGQACPRCGQETVVYNGNYWCDNCTWVMGESGRPARIIRAYLIQRHQEAEAAHDQETMDRMAHYLADYADSTEAP